MQKEKPGSQQNQDELPYEVRHFLEIVERIVLRMVAPPEATSDGSGDARKGIDEIKAQAHE